MSVLDLSDCVTPCLPLPSTIVSSLMPALLSFTCAGSVTVPLFLTAASGEVTPGLK